MILIKLFFCVMQESAISLRQVNWKFREVGGANSSSLKVLLEWTANVHFWTICEITIQIGGPWKWNVVFEKSSKKNLGINTLINKNKDTSNWCRIISHWVHYCYSTQFLTFFVGFFFRQCVIQLPFLSKRGGNTSSKFQRREKTFCGTLVVASLAYKYWRIIRVHLRNIPWGYIS